MQIANVLLAIVAGVIAITLFKISHQQEHLRPWRPLILALVLFAIEETLGALVAFNIMSPTFLTHIIPSLILVVLMYALFLQILEAHKWPVQ